jgi:hypothetical protein
MLLTHIQSQILLGTEVSRENNRPLITVRQTSLHNIVFYASAQMRSKVTSILDYFKLYFHYRDSVRALARHLTWRIMFYGNTCSNHPIYIEFGVFMYVCDIDNI